MNIGFIGLGNMGSGMATKLLTYCQNHQHTLWVLDLNRATVDHFVSQGAEDGQSVQHIAHQCDVIFTSLPSSLQVNQVAYGEAGILSNTVGDTVWFETSTNELAEWEKVRDAAPDELTLIDAPITGGAEGAATGTLTMLLGIEEALLQRFSPLLAAFTQQAIRMGPAGAGYVTKLAQLHLNYLAAQGIGEALMMGAKANLDLDVLHHVLQHSCAQSYVVDSYIPRVLNGSYDPSFTLGLATKDIRLITELGSHLGIEMPLADQVYRTYQHATDQFGTDVPHLSVLKVIENQSNQRLRA